MQLCGGKPDIVARACELVQVVTQTTSKFDRNTHSLSLALTGLESAYTHKHTLHSLFTFTHAHTQHTQHIHLVFGLFVQAECDVDFVDLNVGCPIDQVRVCAVYSSVCVVCKVRRMSREGAVIGISRGGEG